MELKNTMKNNNLNLLMYNLKDKKNWFLVSIAIMTITLIIMPIILGSGINQTIIIVGILEIGTLMFLNSLMDSSYFHDNRKLTYYASKPSTRMARINSLLLSNMAFVFLLLVFLIAIGIFSGVPFDDIKEIFIPSVPWLIIGLFIIPLSSALTGNTIAAGAASIINFTMPLSLLAIIYYGFEVVGHFALGFNPRILFNSFIDNFYRMDILYFVKYVNNNFSWDYFLVLAGWIIVLYSLTLYVVKRRKNERTGDFVVSDGYKNIISILLASLVPIGFSEMFYNTSIASRITSFIILSGLTYYLINAILEKSFRISKYSLKLFAVFILFFGLFVLGTNITAGKFEATVPEASEIRAVYLGTDNYIWSENYEETWDIHNAKEEDIDKSPYAVLYKDPENIEAIVALHKEVIKNQEYYNYGSFNIVYFYENGERLYRYYELTQSEVYDKAKDQYLWKIANTAEFKKEKMPFIYDDEFYKSIDIISFNVHYENQDKYSEDIGINKSNVDMNILREKLKNDFNNVLLRGEGHLNYILMDRYGYYDRYSFDKMIETEVVERKETFNISINYNRGNIKKDDYISFRITEDYIETFEYLKTLKENDMEKLDEIIRAYSQEKENTVDSVLSNDLKEVMV